MAKRWSAMSLVTLSLLVYLLGPEVEAQDWHKPASSMSKGSPPPQAPQVLPPPPPQRIPQNHQTPQVVQPPPPKAPEYPQAPKFVPPPPPPPPAPQYPQAPKFVPPPPPPPRPAPEYPQAPKFVPPPPPPRPAPQYPQAPKFVPPPPPPPPPRPAPEYPQAPKFVPPPPPPPPRPAPEYPQAPKFVPPPPPPPRPAPEYPQAPKFVPPPPPPPPAPQYPQAPKFVPPPPPPPPPPAPQYPQAPRVQTKPPRKHPQYAQVFHDFSQEPQQPEHHAVPQMPSIYKPSAVKEPSVQSCEVTESVRIPCGGPDISAAGCEAINCCFNGQQCYFGKTVTVQCTKDAQFILVVAKDATLPNIDLETISLLGQGQGCAHVDSNSEFAIYHFPVTACGSAVMEESGVIIYENKMSSSYEVNVGPHGVITRDSSFDLLFQCRYIGSSVETVVVEVLPLQNPPLPVAALGPISVHLRLANGQCNTKGCNEVDVAYSSFYTEADYPVTKVLRDPVYVEVQLLEKTDPVLVLTLGRCWTTTSPNPHSLPQWDILIDGCPYSSDHYLSSLVPVGPSSGLDFPSHYRRFIFKMFTFVDSNSMKPLKEQVYIHCSTAVCTAAPGRSCEPSCVRKRRDVIAADQRGAEPKVVATVGPVIMQRPEE